MLPVWLRSSALLFRLFPRLLLVELCLFGAIAISSTWPLAKHLDSSVPLGTEHAATVPLFTSWSVWWNCDRLEHLYGNYWDAPIFYPNSDTFAFSEPLPLSIFGAPIYWLAKSPAAACNTLLLLALTMNGWSAFRLFLRVHNCWIVALLGGLMVELLPFVHHEIAVFQLVPLCGVIWTLHSLHQWLGRPSLRNAVLTGVCCGVTYLLCSYYGLFLAVLLVLGTPWLWWRNLLQFKTWYLASACVLTCAIIISPIVRAQLRVTQEYEFKRARTHVQQFSAVLADYRAAPWQPVWLRAGTSSVTSSRLFSLYPGSFSISLAILGTLLGLWYRRTRRWTLFTLATLVAAVLLSLGPGLRIAGWVPYGLLNAWLPGFAQMRSVFRFAMFAQLMNVQLAVTGLSLLLSFGKASARRRSLVRKRWVPAAVVVVLGVASAVELWPMPQRLFRIPPVNEETAWVAWLCEHTPGDCVVACLPFPTGKSESDYEQTALWMYAGTYHKRQLVNGYSGFFPKSFQSLKAALADFPEVESFRSLQASGVDYCVVDRVAAGNAELESDADAAYVLRRVFADEESQVDIYRLVAESSVDRKSVARKSD
ncbi:MAG: hypothetical protein KDB05_00440 [Planctomycetales bacterium]|nr:hypothetical protein [Planctomycetales bacterium]